MSLRRIERELRAAIRSSNRPDLEAGLGRVGWTDDGGTLYVHVFADPQWRRVREGGAFVLANADYRDVQTLAQVRALMEDARLYLHDDTAKILRWLDGR